MDKKFWISGIVVFVVWMALGFVVHGLVLGNEYRSLTNLFRNENDSQGLFPYMLVAHLIMSFAAAWIYRQGVSAGTSWLIQGVRFGIAVACLMTIPMAMIYYVIQPTPGMLVVKQIVFGSIIWVIAGIVLAFINKK
jgi:hypothetical protein